MTYEARPENGTPLDSAIEEVALISLGFPLEKSAFIEHAHGALVRVRDGHRDGTLTADAACKKLFNLYCHYQGPLQDIPDVAHIIRVVGDDFGVTQGVNEDRLWDMYQHSLDAHA
jgi:hypothetical protein